MESGSRASPDINCPEMWAQKCIILDGKVEAFVNRKKL
jgi:hypothetical protein